MSDTILGGDVTVYYLDENRQKMLKWSGSAAKSATQDGNALYSALETLMDSTPQSDDGSVMFADTAVEYTLGIIDAGDKEPWYIQFRCVQHLTGASIRTSGWTRSTGSAVGIIVVPVTSNAIVQGDEGLAISGATTGSGTLLEVIEQGTTDYLVIRPDDDTAPSDFTTASQTITCNGHTASQSGAVSFTGEMVWANLYNVTPIDDYTHVYVYQGTVADATRARVQDINQGGGDWWTDGAFDRLYPTRDYKQAGFPTIDDGYLACFARKGNTLYDSFEVSTSTTSGGRNPIPLKASNDGNHTVGYASITLSGGSGNWTAGDEISGDTSGARAIITLVTGTNPTPTLHFYYIGDPLTAFNGTEAITNVDDTGAATGSGAVANQGPALAGWFTNAAFPSVTHGNTTVDIDNDGTAEGYGITLDCNSNPFDEVYQWSQYILQNGQTGTSNTDGIEGEQYVGGTVYLEYSGTVTGGTIAEGDDVTQASTLATGVVISHDTTLKQILLRDTRGTFNTANAVTSNDNAGAITPNVAAQTFAAWTDAPFMRLAGGRAFFARGVVPANWLAVDENNFETIPVEGGGPYTRPDSISIAVTNLEGGAESSDVSDIVSIYQLTGSGGVINKTEFTAAGGEAAGDATLAVGSAIPATVVGKTLGGSLTIRDNSDNNKEYRLRFSSWTGSTFTLANIVIAAADAATTTTIQETGAFATAKRGDLVYNITRGAVSYITRVVDNDNVVIYPAITGQTTGDNIEINALPIAPSVSDNVYVAIMQRYAASSEESVSKIYTAPIFFRVKVTNKRATTKIRAFVTNTGSSGANVSVQTIRNADPIAA